LEGQARLALPLGRGAWQPAGMTHLHSLDGAPLSSLTFGTMQFGGRADADESRAMYDAARAAGITHFDTATGYTEGASETLLGQFVAGERDAVFVATKVGYEGGAGPANITAQFEASLRRLGMEQVDLLYLHRWHDDMVLEETFGTLARWQDQGRIRHIGVSNYAAWQVMKAQGVAARLGTRIDVIQPMYNLVKRQAEVEILPMALDQGLSVCPYSPLGGGLLTGKYAAGGSGRLTEDARYAARYAPGWMHEAAVGLAALAAQTGVAPATLAVAWAAAHPARPAPIISARSLDQLRPSLAAADFVLTPALHARITALSPAPAPATDRLEEA